MASDPPLSYLGAALLSGASELATYREIRARLLDAEARADASFRRYFEKTLRGEPTSGAAASRLANEANYLSADLAGAELALFAFEIDPREVDKIDGVYVAS